MFAIQERNEKCLSAQSFPLWNKLILIQIYETFIRITCYRFLVRSKYL